MKHYSFGDNRKCLKKTYDKSHMKAEHQIWFWYAVFIKQDPIWDLWNKSYETTRFKHGPVMQYLLTTVEQGQQTFLKGNMKLGPSKMVLICSAY